MKKITKKGPVLHKVLSDQGVHLEQAHRRSENSNILHDQTAFTMQSSSGSDFAVKVGKRCPQCKMRVRGLNHEQGDHHKGTVTKCRR